MSDTIPPRPLAQVGHLTETAFGGSSPAVGTDVGHSDGYYERKAAGRCTRRGCALDAAPGVQLCARHLQRKRKSDRASARRLRRERRDAGKCATPGCEAKCDTWLCPACAIRFNRVPRSAVGPAVGNSAREPRGIWRDDANGWHRFRGRGKRGAPPAGANDESDIRMVLVAIQRGTEALAYARSPEVADLGRITKQAALNEAAALFGHAERGLEELGDRLRKGK